jgi:hypothetical protein
MDRELMVVSLSFRVITTLSHLKLGLLYRWDLLSLLSVFLKKVLNCLISWCQAQESTSNIFVWLNFSSKNLLVTTNTFIDCNLNYWRVILPRKAKLWQMLFVLTKYYLLCESKPPWNVLKVIYVITFPWLYFVDKSYKSYNYDRTLEKCINTQKRNLNPFKSISPSNFIAIILLYHHNKYLTIAFMLLIV